LRLASQMAQQKEFNLKKPSAYHYDILLLGFMVCIYDLSLVSLVLSYLCHSYYHQGLAQVIGAQGV
jgi:hypothetical protein